MSNRELLSTQGSVRNSKFVRSIGIALFLTCIVVFGILAKALWVTPHKPDLQSGSFLPEPRQIDSFSLVSDAGTPFTLADFRGHWTLVFAGYSYCPEICPTTLAMLKAAKANLGGDAKRLKVLFLSIGRSSRISAQASDIASSRLHSLAIFLVARFA